MSLIWHIALKDLRRLRCPVVLWAALIAAKLSMGVILVFGIGRQFDPFRFANYWISLLEVVAGYLLVAAVLHGDVLVGSHSFWMTRPVSGSRLFTAKLVALAVVFGAIPLALTLPWWLWCGYGAREVGLAALETIGLQGLVVALALPAASLTDGMSRYLFWTLITMTALICLASSLAGIPAGGLWVSSLILVASGVVGAAFHWLKRRFVAGATVLGAAGSGAVALGVVLIFSAHSRDRIPPGTEQASPQIQFSPLSFVRADVAPKNRDRMSLLIITAQMEALPPESVLEGTALHRWSWPDGLVLERTAALETMGWGNNLQALGLPPPHRDAAAIARENEWRRRMGRPELPSTDATFLIDSQPLVPRAFENRVLRDPPAYSLRAEMALMRPVVMGECPAEMGETIKSAAEGTRVIVRTISGEFPRSYRRGDARVLPSTQSGIDPATGRPRPVVVLQRLYLALSEYRSTVLGSGDPFSGIGPFLFSGWPRRTYAVVNRSRGNAVQDDSFYHHDTFRTDAVRIGTVGIVWRMMQVSPPTEYSVSEGRSVEQTNWFEGVTLAKLQLRTEEQFTKELRVERFQFGPGGSTRRTP